MPSEQRLGAGQEGSPCRLGQDAADLGHHEPIGGLPGDPADLSFQNAKLVAERQHLDAKHRRGAAADVQDLQQRRTTAPAREQRKIEEHCRAGSAPEAARTLAPKRTDAVGVNGTGQSSSISGATKINTMATQGKLRKHGLLLLAQADSQFGEGPDRPDSDIRDHHTSRYRKNNPTFTVKSVRATNAAKVKALRERVHAADASANDPCRLLLTKIRRTAR
jgi:hypothetical protein